MTTKTKYRIFAVLICIVIYFIYIVIATELGWKHGGGFLVLAILFGIISWVWKTAGELAAKKDAEKTKDGEAVEQAESLKTGEMLADECVDTPPIQKPSSEETHVEEPVEELPPIPVSEDVVEEAPKAPDVSPEEPNTNSPSNEKKKNSRKGLIILVCTITAIALSGVIAYSLIVIPKNKQRKAAEELYIKGRDAYHDKLYELAIKHFVEAAQIDSLNWGIYYMIGNCYYKQNEYGDSYYWYNKAYDYNPQHNNVVMCGDTLHYEKYLYRYSGSLIDAHPLSEKSLQIAQEYYSLYKDKSDSYRLMIFAHLFYAKELSNDKSKKSKHKNTSLQWANKMVKDFPDNDDSYFCLAYVQAEEDDNRSAITNYKKCIELDPKNEKAYNNLGLCYEEIGSYNLAGKCYEKAIELGETSYAPENLKDLKRHGHY